MEKISLQEYKQYLIRKYRYECDNTVESINERNVLLNKKYSDIYLQDILDRTYYFVEKLFELSQKDYFGYIKIDLDTEPSLDMIFLNLTGGYPSDTIVSDSLGNLYSIGIIRKIFGEKLIIEPFRVDSEDVIEEIDDMQIVSQVFSYYSYFQCDQSVINEARKRVKV